MNTLPTLQMRYRHVLELSQSLLRLARSENWDEMLTLQQNYFTAINDIQRESQQTPPPAAALHQLRPLLSQLLDNEEALKKLVLLPQGELRQLLSPS